MNNEEPKREYLSNQSDSSVSQPLQQSQPSEPKSLEELAVEEVIKMTGKNRDILNAKFSAYGTETFPVGSGYIGGTYLTVKDTKDGDLFVFTSGGIYLGNADPLGIKMESRRGFGNAWKSKEAGSDTERVFVWTESAASTVYWETPTENNQVLREWAGEGPNPVYRVIGNRLQREQKPYIGTFSGDGRHNIDDRGNGLFFVVQKEVRDKNGKILEESGELHRVVTPEYNSSFVQVKRKAGSSMFLPNFEFDTAEQENVYKTIVPKFMQTK